MEYFSKNLIFLREKVGKTQDAQAEFLKIKRTTYAGYEKGTSKPNFQTLIEISELLGVPVGDLVDKDLSIGSIGVKESTSNYSKRNPLFLIPIESLTGQSSGDVSVLNGEGDQYIIPEFNKKADYLIKISGSSMSPKYYSGDIVACKKIPLQTFIQWGKVYVMDTIQGPLCKRLFESKEGYVKVVSDNEMYPPFEMSVKEIRSLAIVIGVIRLE